jgi:hypothetical protein
MEILANQAAARRERGAACLPGGRGAVTAGAGKRATLPSLQRAQRQPA